MSKRKVPDTSRSAFEAKKATIESDWQRIVKALQVIGVGNYQQIAKQAHMGDVAVNRRLSEMRKGDKPLVKRLETKSDTTSGNKARNYCLSENVSIASPHPVKALTDKTKEAKRFLNTLFP